MKAATLLLGSILICAACGDSSNRATPLSAEAGPVTPVDDAAVPDDDGGAEASSDDAADAAPPPWSCASGTKGGSKPGGLIATPGGTALLVRVPAAYNPTVGAPLIVVYAAAGGDPYIMELFTQLTAPANKRGYIVAYLDHITPFDTGATAEAASAVPTVTDQWCVDPKRIYLTGHSDGGSLTELIAVNSLVATAAIAPSAAGVNDQNMASFACRSSLPVMEMHSSGDYLFPIAQGYGANVAAWWAKCDQCNASPGSPASNGCVAYGGCNGGVDVRYCQGTGEHGDWPLSLDPSILDFFDAYRLP